MNDAVGQPKLVEVKLEGLSGEETEHDRLAEGGRENGHPEVHFLAVLGPRTAPSHFNFESATT
jgi:hypothetical protein